MTNPIKTRKQIINDKVEEFEEKFCFEELGKKKLYTNKDQTDDIKSFLRQALEAEKTKREAMVREMIESQPDKIKSSAVGFGNARFEVENNLKQELIKIAKKYGVEV